jgi:hypothetical protein
MPSTFLDKHWWIGVFWILSSIAIAPSMSAEQSKTFWLVRELPTYSAFFMGAFWTTLFSHDHPIIMGLSHLVTVTVLVIGLNYSYDYLLRTPEFTGWNGFALNLMIGIGVAVVTVIPGVIAGVLTRAAT